MDTRDKSRIKQQLIFTGQVGMNPHKARRLLNRNIIYHFFADRIGRVFCYRCSCLIEPGEDFDVDHRIPYLNQENPREMYFSLNNIAASHVHCNRRENVRLLTDEKKNP